MNDVMEDLLRWLRNPCADTASDIVVLAMKEIRRLRDDPNRSQCELGALFAEVGRLRKEVEMLRMTPADHEAVAWAVEVSDSLAECGGAGISPGATNKTSATLRDLARRHRKD